MAAPGTGRPDRPPVGFGGRVMTLHSDARKLNWAMIGVMLALDPKSLD